MSAPQTVRSATRRLVGLTALRWLPVGLTTPITVLLAQARGLSARRDRRCCSPCTASWSSSLELPTGGLADVLGRRPVVVAGAVLHLGSCLRLRDGDELRRVPGRRSLLLGRRPGAGLRAGRGLVRRHRPPHRPGGRRRARAGEALGRRRRQPRRRRGRRRVPARRCSAAPAPQALALPYLGAAVLDLVFIVAVVRLLTEDRPPREGSVARGARRGCAGRARRR